MNSSRWEGEGLEVEGIVINNNQANSVFQGSYTDSRSWSSFPLLTRRRADVGLCP